VAEKHLSISLLISRYRVPELLISEHPASKSFPKLMLNKQPLIERLLKIFAWQLSARDLT